MKKNFQKVLLFTLFVLAIKIVSAQEEFDAPATPRWISDKGYWIIESNIKSPDTATVHFYNMDNVQVYSERVEGMTLNLKKRKTLMGLKKVLDQSLLAWEKSHVSKDNAQLVQAIFKQKKNSW